MPCADSLGVLLETISSSAFGFRRVIPPTMTTTSVATGSAADGARSLGTASSHTLATLDALIRTMIYGLRRPLWQPPEINIAERLLSDLCETAASSVPCTVLEPRAAASARSIDADSTTAMGYLSGCARATKVWTSDERRTSFAEQNLLEAVSRANIFEAKTRDLLQDESIEILPRSTCADVMVLAYGTSRLVNRVDLTFHVSTAALAQPRSAGAGGGGFGLHALSPLRVARARARSCSPLWRCCVRTASESRRRSDLGWAARALSLS